MPLITCRNLGSMGRAGNQLFLYAFAKGYAKHMGCEFQTSDWWGRKVFVNATEPICTRDLPQTESDGSSSKPLLYFAGDRDIDINVYAQHQYYLDYYTRKEVREWFKLKPEFECYGSKCNLHSYSAAHQRKGDYIHDANIRQSYCQIADGSYWDAIVKFDIPDPIWWVYEGAMPAPKALVAQGLEWLMDFITLRDATHLLRANSTFSWWSATLSDAKVYSPVVGARIGIHEVEWVEGNWPCTAGKFKNQSNLFLREA